MAIFYPTINREKAFVEAASNGTDQSETAAQRTQRAALALKQLILDLYKAAGRLAQAQSAKTQCS